MIFGRIKLWLAAAGAFVIALGAAYWRGRSNGIGAERNRQVQHRLSDMKKAQEVRDEVHALDDIGLANRASRWLRDDN